VKEERGENMPALSHCQASGEERGQGVRRKRWRFHRGILAQMFLFRKVFAHPRQKMEHGYGGFAWINEKPALQRLVFQEKIGIYFWLDGRRVCYNFLSNTESMR